MVFGEEEALFYNTMKAFKEKKLPGTQNRVPINQLIMLSPLCTLSLGHFPDY